MRVQLKCQWKSLIVEGSNGWAKLKREVHSLTVMDVNKDKLGSTCTVAFWKLKVNWFVFKLPNDPTIHSSRPVWPIFNSVATFPDLSESADWSDGQKFDHRVFNKHVFLWGQTSSPLAAQLCCGHSGRTERVLLVAAVTPESGRKFSPHPAESLLSSSCFSEANLFFFTCRLWIFSHICGRKGKTQIVWI